jgi:hypothetical protein
MHFLCGESASLCIVGGEKKGYNRRKEISNGKKRLFTQNRSRRAENEGCSV